MILSNDSLVAFHYRSYGTFFLHKNRLHNIYRGFTHYKYYRAECYTSQLLYRYSHQEKLFTLYDSKGELLKGDVSENYHSYQNLRSGETYTQWQLVSLYLANNSTVEDRFIIDMVNE